MNTLFMPDSCSLSLASQGKLVIDAANMLYNDKGHLVNYVECFRVSTKMLSEEDDYAVQEIRQA